MRVSAVWYSVAAWEDAKLFYGETLGLALNGADDDAGWAAFETENVPLFLIRAPETAGQPGGAVVSLEVEDLDAFGARLLAAGATVDDTLQEGADSRILTFYDPDGNRLEASQSVPAPE